MTIADEIEKLSELKNSGAMSEQEFEEAKARLLSSIPRPPPQLPATPTPLTSSEVNMWGLFVHLSQFCSYIIPLAGIVVPIILWQIKKDESELINEHGKNVVNWVVSEIIYMVISFILCFVIIGFVMLIVLVILAIIFPIIGAVKASNGETWHYPGAIRFLK